MPPHVPPPQFTLTEQEKTEPLWLRLKDHLTTRLDLARRRNDGPLTEQETATLRGEIASLRDFIALGKPAITTGDKEPIARF